MTWRPDRFELWFYTRLERVLHAVARRRERAEERRSSAAISRPRGMTDEEAERWRASSGGVTVAGWTELRDRYDRAHACLCEALEHVRAAQELLERMRREGRASDPAATRWERLH